MPRAPALPCLSMCPPALLSVGLQFRTSTYHALGARLKQLADQLCGGRIVFLLEGG